MSIEHKVHRIQHHHHYHLHHILESHHLYIHNQSIQNYILNHQENLERQRELRYASRQNSVDNQNRLSITSNQSLPALPIPDGTQNPNKQLPPHLQKEQLNSEQQYQSLVDKRSDYQHQHMIAPEIHHQARLPLAASPIISTSSSLSPIDASTGPSQCQHLRNRRHDAHSASLPLKSASKQRSQIHFFLLSAFAYILSPIDLIPEMVFGVFGILDDLLFLFLCLFCVAIILLYPLFREIRRTLLSKVGLEQKLAQQQLGNDTKILTETNKTN